MSHSYPLAETAQDAFDADAVSARTRRGAERKADGAAILSLETEWLTLEWDEAEELLDKAEAASGSGFVQRYADASGSTVLAVTYWKLSVTGRKNLPEATPATETGAADDHTDDLYFRSGRTKRKRRKRQPKIDPRQLDLFSAPDQTGYEHRAAENPGVVITDEEGDGTAFGVAPSIATAKPRKARRKTRPHKKGKPRQKA